MHARTGGRTFPRTVAAAALVAALFVPAGRLAADEGEEGTAPAIAAAKSLEDSFAHVEVTLRYDEGQPPSTIGSGRREYASLVQEERPLDLAGIVLAPDRVLTLDPQLHPRFVAGITVSLRGQRVPAKPVAWAANGDAVVLALEKPLEGAKPLAFDAAGKPPYRAVYHGRSEGLWVTVVGTALQRVTVDEEGRATADAWSPAVLLDAAGKPVGVTTDSSVPLDGAWKGSPLSWPLVTAEERERLVARTEAAANAALLRVHVRLRSPKADGGGRSPFSYRSDSKGDETERNAVGVLVDDRRVLVLESMDAKATARIESIEVHAQDGEAVPATFVGSYRYFGALLVETARALPGRVSLDTTPMRRHREHLLLGARLEIQGERRVLHCSHYRVSSFEEGWRRQVLPSVSDAADHFLFDREGALVALPVARRLPEQEEYRWRRSSEEVLLPAEYVAALVADLAANADPANVPVPAEREDRLAWLGVETQKLDRDLARANGVSHLTRDGETGALVSYVYEGSPAQNAKIEAGAVLLRIHAPDRPKPIDVSASEDPMSSFRGMFEGMEDFEERFGDRMGGMHPWPSGDNEVNRTLTQIGFGKTVTIEYAVGGEVKKAEMTVAEGPIHFEAAPLHKSEEIGATVKDLTYEVRRYYQLDAALPAVIVSKVERGERAAVAGLRRFDIVLRVNDQPVADAAAFGKAVAATGELRLTVKDKLKERVVKIAAR